MVPCSCTRVTYSIHYSSSMMWVSPLMLSSSIRICKLTIYIYTNSLISGGRDSKINLIETKGNYKSLL